MKKLMFLALAVFAVALPALGSAQSFYAATERPGSDGTIDRYGSLADAQAEINPIFSGLMPQRDQSVFVTRNVPAVYHDSFYKLVNWYSDGGANQGVGNPNNTNFGFDQLADDDASTIASWDGHYQLDLNTFVLTANGLNATYVDDFARLDNAGNPPGSGESTIGTWLSYDLNLTVTGLNAVSNGDGTYSNTTNGSGYSGTYTGIFLNQSVTSPGSNDWYVLHQNFNNTSWATSNGFALDDEFTAAAVPEPATMAVLGLGLAALLRRRRC